MANSFPLSLRISRLVISGRRWVVIAMLLALHGALLSDPGGNFQRIWLMVHFGFFLLWQPFYAAERELEVLSVVLIFAITAVILWFLSGWMIVTWVSVLIGIAGGRVFTVQATRRGRFYLVAFFYLAAILLLWAVPRLVLPEQPIPEAVAMLAGRVLPFLLITLAFLPFDTKDDDQRQVFDFFYAVLVFQLVIVLVLGSVAIMRYTDQQYFRSVLVTVIGFGAALFIFAVLWSPRGGFGGLRTYFSRYLLSVGMPFEVWVRRVAELAVSEPDTRRFLGEALREVSVLPWIRGARWSSPDGKGEFGEATGYATRFAFHGLELTFFTEISLSPALFLHMRLLAQVVGEFYEGKRREATLRKTAYLQAVHETGARLTHDIKNLLQSLYVLTSAAPREGEVDAAHAALLNRQLPQLTRRLQATLDQMRTPEIATTEIQSSVRDWWADVERRYGGTEVRLAGAIEADVMIPRALFDSFLENGIANARGKYQRDGALEFGARLEVRGVRAVLEVWDNGTQLPGNILHSLFRDPVARPSGQGLGIGLYQVARLAAQWGYGVQLAANEPGHVVFRLHPGGAAVTEGGPP